ncbi:MAG: hypothetical protein AMXMBFR34_17680 [Myxococcaceae bacterium]
MALACAGGVPEATNSRSTSAVDNPSATNFRACWRATDMGSSSSATFERTTLSLRQREGPYQPHRLQRKSLTQAVRRECNKPDAPGVVPRPAFVPLPAESSAAAPAASTARDGK